MRTLRTWEHPLTLQCPLCGDQFDLELLHPWWIRDYGPPRWCGRCLSFAWGSPVATRDTALTAVRFFTDLLGTPPTNEWQRQPLPHRLDDALRDRLMAARMAMPDVDSLKRLGLTNWLSTLDLAGVLQHPVRGARGVSSRARDGHWCRSLFELAVDDFLSLNGVAHECEPAWPYHPLLNPHGGRRADWELPDGTLVEAAGMMTEDGYARKMVEKGALAREFGLRLLVIEPVDLSRLNVVFAEWLPWAQARRPLFPA